MFTKKSHYKTDFFRGKRHTWSAGSFRWVEKIRRPRQLWLGEPVSGCTPGRLRTCEACTSRPELVPQSSLPAAGEGPRRSLPPAPLREHA